MQVQIKCPGGLVAQDSGRGLLTMQSETRLLKFLQKRRSAICQNLLDFLRVHFLCACFLCSGLGCCVLLLLNSSSLSCALETSSAYFTDFLQ